MGIINRFREASPRPKKDIFTAADDDWPEPHDMASSGRCRGTEDDLVAAAKSQVLGGVTENGWPDPSLTTPPEDQAIAVAATEVEMRRLATSLGRFYIEPPRQR